jgi:hypothetical protein
MFKNNDFYAYVELLYSRRKIWSTECFSMKVLQVLPILLKKILVNAFIEIVLLILFYLVLSKMSQGRDLIVSMFEPDGLYGLPRIIFTLLSVVSFSVSMWIIPAFIFEYQDRLRQRKSSSTRSMFKQHLFFIHRILAIIPFWVLSSSFFYSTGNRLVFFFVSISIVVSFYFINRYVKRFAVRKKFLLFLAALFIIGFYVFSQIYQHTYHSAKVLLSIELYLLSVIMFLLYHHVDDKVLHEHQFGRTLTNVWKKYKINSTFYIIVLVIHVIVVSILYLWPNIISIAPESMLLYVFSLYVFVLDLILYLVNLSQKVKSAVTYLFFIVVFLYATPLVNFNLSHYALDVRAKSDYSGDLRSLNDYYEQWKKRITDRVDKSKPFPIVLISGEGGGSRGGLWFSQNLINLDYLTQGKFRDHIFSMSTVSGSSVGLGTVYSFWESANFSQGVSEEWLSLPEKVYSQNYVGSGVLGFTLKDLLKSIWPFDEFHADRNSDLQKEEAIFTSRALQTVSTSGQEGLVLDSNLLERDMMSFFYRRQNGKLEFRSDRPVAFINSCRSDDGRRAIFSPISLDAKAFHDAIDITSYIYCKSFCNYNKDVMEQGLSGSISFVQATNTSELFPFFSAPAYVKDLGHFVDGGYHENSGLKTTLDIYDQLKSLLAKDSSELQPKKDYVIYILYLKNGPYSKNLYSKIDAELPILQPFNAIINLPFAGNESYYEERANLLDKESDSLIFTRIQLNNFFVLDTNKANSKLEKEILLDMGAPIDENPRDTAMLLNLPLARWLSASVIDRIKRNSPTAIGEDRKLKSLLLILDDSAMIRLVNINRHFSRPKS